MHVERTLIKAHHLTRYLLIVLELANNALNHTTPSRGKDHHIISVRQMMDMRGASRLQHSRDALILMDTSEEDREDLCSKNEEARRQKVPLPQAT